MRTEKAGNTLILIPEQIQIDTLNAEEFKQELLSAAAEAPRILIDISSIQFIDSSGLGILLGMVREMHEKGGEISLCCAQPPVQALFRMVHMANIVTIHSSREDALESLQS